jgi:hypothetical protein
MGARRRAPLVHSFLEPNRAGIVATGGKNNCILIRPRRQYGLLRPDIAFEQPTQFVLHNWDVPAAHQDQHLVRGHGCRRCDKALALATKFPRLGDDGEAIMRAHAAIINPALYRQLNRDPAALCAAGIEALRRRYG